MAGNPINIASVYIVKSHENLHVCHKTVTKEQRGRTLEYFASRSRFPLFVRSVSVEEIRREKHSSSSPSCDSTGKAMDSNLVAKHVQLRNWHRREGSLAAALAQSIALAVMSMAGAYPSWVLVKGEKRSFVLGATWAVHQVDPPPDSPLLGSSGASILLAITYCCLLSTATGSLALTLDFLGLRWGRTLAPMLHGFTAVLNTTAAACGSYLLALIRVRVRTVPALAPFNYSTSPGQSLFLCFLACIVTATATGFSCASPARVQPARSSWDFGRPAKRRAHRTEMEERPPSMESVIWQQDRLSPFLLHSSEDYPKRSRWVYAAQDPDACSPDHSFLRAMMEDSLYGLSQKSSSLQDSSLERYCGSSSISIESRLPPLRAPAPSMIYQLPQEETEDDDDPVPGGEPDPELQPAKERESDVGEANSGV